MILEFKEEQKFDQWWFWFLLIAASNFVFYHIYMELMAQESFQISIGLIISALLVVAFYITFFTIRLKTEIDKDGIRMKYSPFFIQKNIEWKDIKSVKVIDYGFIGGWGVRFWTKYGTVYNTRGSKGLAIELKNGDKFLIGTREEKEMKKVVVPLARKHLTNKGFSF